jgi:serine/threonine-protein kinase
VSLASGTRLGPYEVIAQIGVGGMGEVYRARDTRLDRDVAIKVSSTEFSERFAREARSIAALNHSNICHLYDVGPNYLVLEYIEGENLRGPMSWDEALPIVRQLIDGIEAAHERNIIHRDLKTANIRITPEGVVRFSTSASPRRWSPSRAAIPPTRPPSPWAPRRPASSSAPPLTCRPSRPGASRPTGAATSGASASSSTSCSRGGPFGGETAVEILGAVMNKEPDWSAVPPRAQRLLRWCLEKERRKRLAAISDARILLEGSGAVAQPSVSDAKRKSLLLPAVAATLALLAAGFGYGWRSATRPVDRPLTRLSVDLGPDAVRNPGVTVVPSPDGSRIVFTGRSAKGGRQLFMRRLDQAVATPLAGTELVGLPTWGSFFSPDGEWMPSTGGATSEGKCGSPGLPPGPAGCSGRAVQRLTRHPGQPRRAEN